MYPSNFLLNLHTTQSFDISTMYISFNYQQIHLILISETKSLTRLNKLTGTGIFV